MNRRDALKLIRGSAAAAVVGNVLSVRAQSVRTPENLRLVVGYPPGGSLDTVARALADRLQGVVARIALVENRPGASGRIAGEQVKSAAADGSVGWVAPSTTFTLYPHIYKKLPWESADEFTPVAGLTAYSLGLAVGPSVPPEVRNVRQFLAWAKDNRALANYGSPGNGSPMHLLGALLAVEGSAPLIHVPYRGTAPAVQALLGGELSAAVLPEGEFLPHLKAGRIRMLATSGAERSRFTPEVPTLVQSGFAQMVFAEWHGLFMPGRVPSAVMERLEPAVQSAVKSDEFAQAVGRLGLNPAYRSPAQMRTVLRDELQHWAPIVSRIGFTPES